MSWFKVDDGFWRSRKVRKLGKQRVRVTAQVAGAGIWTLSGDWAADNLTDGFVPWEVVEDWDPDREIAQKLIAVGLWYETEYDGETGIQFHDWSDWQPTKVQVEQRRKADAERRARWREQLRNGKSKGGVPASSQVDEAEESRRDTDQDTTRDTTSDANCESGQGSLLPGPARPGPVSSNEDTSGGASRRKPERKMPPSWRPNDQHAAFCGQNNLDVAEEAQKLRDYADANDLRQRDWDAKFRQWLRNAVRFRDERRGRMRVVETVDDDPAVTGRRRVEGY